MSDRAVPQPPVERPRQPIMPCEIKSQRLLLMAIVPADVDQILAGARESFKELQPYMDWSKTIATRDVVATFIGNSTTRRAQRTEFNYSIWLGHDRAGRTLERYVGNIGVFDINWEVPRFEIGYWVRTSQTGNGYATEAVRKLCSILIDLYHASRVELRIDARNIGSQRVAQRAGFKHEATLCRYLRANDGSLIDYQIHALLPDLSES